MKTTSSFSATVVFPQQQELFPQRGGVFVQLFHQPTDTEKNQHSRRFTTSFLAFHGHNVFLFEDTMCLLELKQTVHGKLDLAIGLHRDCC